MDASLVTSMQGICPDRENENRSTHHLPITLEEGNLILDDVQQQMNVRSDVITRLVNKLCRHERRRNPKQEAVE